MIHRINEPDMRKTINKTKILSFYPIAIFREMINARITGIIVLVLIGAIWGMDQFFDFLIALPEEYEKNNSILRIIWYLIDNMVLGLLVWFSLRKILGMKPKKNNKNPDTITTLKQEYIDGKLNTNNIKKNKQEELREINNKKNKIIRYFKFQSRNFARKYIPLFLPIILLLQFSFAIFHITLENAPETIVYYLPISILISVLFIWIGQIISRRLSYSDEIGNNIPLESEHDNVIQEGWNFIKNKIGNKKSKSETIEQRKFRKLKLQLFKKYIFYNFIFLVFIFIIFIFICAYIRIAFGNMDFTGRLNAIGIMTLLIAFSFSLIDLSPKKINFIWNFVDKKFNAVLNENHPEEETDLKRQAVKIVNEAKESINRSPMYFVAFIFLMYFLLLVLNNSVFTDRLDDIYFPLTAIVTSLTLWIIGLNYLQKLGREMELPFITLGFVFILGISHISNIHLNNSVHEVSTETDQHRQLIRLDKHFNIWKDQLPSSKTEEGKIPIFIVMSQGGGSRAAAWTYRVLSTLDRNTQNRFSRHCYAISSVSGGSFGSSVFLANKKADLINEISLKKKNNSSKYIPPDDHKVFEKVFAKNFLATSLTLFMGKDLLKSILPYYSFDFKSRKFVKSKDRDGYLEMQRSKRLESIYQHEHIDTSSGEIYRNNFLDIWYGDSTFSEYKIPLFFPNTTWVEKGSRAICSPLSEEGFRLPNTLNITYELMKDPIDVNKNKLEGRKDIEFRSAAHLSSRFPFVNSAGEIEGIGHFVDGGYYDNLGAQTGMGLIENLNKLLDDSKDTTFQIHVIRIYNGDTDNRKKKQKNILQLTAPAIAILNTPFTGHMDASTELLEIWEEFGKINTIYDFNLNTKNMKMKLPTDKKESKVRFPLARYLSNRAAKGIFYSLPDTQDTSKVKYIDNSEFFNSSKDSIEVLKDTIIRENEDNLNRIMQLLE